MIGKVTKVKAFTLIEILIAAVIFATVAVIASSSLSMIIASSNKTDDLTSSENCVRQVSDYVKAAVSTNHYGQRIRIVMPGASADKFKIKEFGKVTAENSTRSSGIAVFDSPGTFKIIYKQDGQYLIQGGNVFDANASHEYAYSSDNSAIHSDSCKFYTSAPPSSDWGSLVDADGGRLYVFQTPFLIERHIRSQAAASPTNALLAKSENRAYIINIRDVAYRASDAGQVVADEATAKLNNIYSRLDLTLSESEMSI